MQNLKKKKVVMIIYLEVKVEENVSGEFIDADGIISDIFEI